MSQLAGWKMEAEQAKAAAEGVARQAAALTQRATALSHLQRLPGELQVCKLLSVFLNSLQYFHPPDPPADARFCRAHPAVPPRPVPPPAPPRPAAGPLHRYGFCARGSFPARLPQAPQPGRFIAPLLP